MSNENQPTNEGIVTGEGSAYNQYSKTLEYALGDSKSESDIPVATYSFTHDGHGYVKDTFDEKQQNVGVEQMTIHFTQIRNKVPGYEGNISYLRDSAEFQLKCGQAWVKEQK